METVVKPISRSVTIMPEKGMVGKSLMIFEPDNYLREIANTVVKHKYFDSFILLIIVMSTVTMAVDNPLNDPNSVLAYNLSIVDIVFTTIFTAEALLKIIQ